MNDMENISNVIHRVVRVRVNFGLTKEVQQQIYRENDMEILCGFMDEFQKFKSICIDNGNSIIAEDVKDWVLILEK